MNPTSDTPPPKPQFPIIYLNPLYPDRQFQEDFQGPIQVEISPSTQQLNLPNNIPQKIAFDPQQVESTDQLTHHHRRKLFRKSLINENQLEQFDMLSESIPEETMKKMMPLIILSIISLIYGFILSCFIYQGIKLSKLNTIVQEAHFVIKDFKYQYTIKGFQEISNADFMKYPSSGCPDQFQLVLFDKFAQVQKGCICPNLQTSTQLCHSPCSHVNNMDSVSYTKFLGAGLCTLQSTKGSKSLNTREIAQKNQMGQPNVIKVGEWYYKFSHSDKNDISIMQYYKFSISPSPPCVNPGHAPYLKSKLTYPFSKKPFTGCDSFGDKAALVDPLGKTTLGELFIENNITQKTTGLPFWDTYFNQADPLILYIVRKWYMDKHQQCQLTFTFPFGTMHNCCLLKQLATQLLCFFAFILMITAVCFFAYALIMIKLLKLRDQFNRSFNDEAKWQLSEVCMRSIVQLNMILFIAIFITKCAYLFAQNYQYGLIVSAEVLNTLLSIPCFQNKAINNALLSLLNVAENCTSNVDDLFNALIWGELFMLLIQIGLGISTSKRGKNYFQQKNKGS